MLTCSLHIWLFSSTIQKFYFLSRGAQHLLGPKKKRRNLNFHWSRGAEPPQQPPLNTPLITNDKRPIHRLIKITDRTLDVFFSRPRSLCLVILRQLRETPLGCCLWVIMNEFHPNFEKTTSSVPFVILINLWTNWIALLQSR